MQSRRGTTNDKSKFIPITHEGLQNVHYQGGKDVLAYYLSTILIVNFLVEKDLFLVEVIRQIIIFQIRLLAI